MRRRLSDARLRDAERKAPKPWFAVTMTRRIIAPNIVDGIWLDPIVLGIGSICRSRRNQPPIDIVFDPPRADLLDVDLGELSDDEISALGNSHVEN